MGPSRVYAALKSVWGHLGCMESLRMYLLLFASSYVLIVCTVPLPPSVNPIAVDKYIYLSIYGALKSVWGP